jgi:type I restriction enzyme M protein
LTGTESQRIPKLVAGELTAHVDELLHAFDEAGVVDALEAVEQIASLPDDRATQERVFEYLLGKLGAPGSSTTAPTPRHIVALMVEMAAPTPADTIIDPAVGTGGFLTAAADYLRDQHPRIWVDTALRDHFNNTAFTGVDSEAALGNIARMNLRLHGVQNPEIQQRDSLAEEGGRRYSLVFANPPLGGARDVPAAKQLHSVVRTKRTDLLYVAHSLRLLADGGRAAIIVPDAVLFGTTKAHKDLRRTLVDDHSVEAVVRLPAGVLRPISSSAGSPSSAVSILLVRRGAVTRNVWFYDLRADGFAADALTTDDKRLPTETNDLTDLLTRWRAVSAQTAASEADRPRTAQSFLVPRAEIAEHDYDLTFNRYRLVPAEHVVYRSPNDILIDVARLELQIQQAAAGLARSLSEQPVVAPQPGIWR